MAKKLLAVGALMLCLACGIEEADSLSKFISKTQEDTSLVGKHMPAGHMLMPI